MPLAILDTQDLKARQQELLAERKQVEALLQELQAGSPSETIAAAQSKVKSWQSQLKLAQIKAQRRQELHTSGAISREQLDIAKVEVDTLQANLNESQSKLKDLTLSNELSKWGKISKAPRRGHDQVIAWLLLPLVMALTLVLSDK